MAVTELLHHPATYTEDSLRFRHSPLYSIYPAPSPRLGWPRVAAVKGSEGWVSELPHLKTLIVNGLPHLCAIDTYCDVSLCVIFSGKASGAILPL